MLSYLIEFHVVLAASYCLVHTRDNVAGNGDKLSRVWTMHYSQLAISFLSRWST